MAQQQPQSELYNQNNPYMWPRSKCWIRAYKRVFNTLRLKSHIWIILVCSLLGRQLKKIKLFI